MSTTTEIPSATEKPVKTKKSTTKVKKKSVPKKKRGTLPIGVPSFSKNGKQLGRPPKKGLRTMQLRVLAVLSDPANSDGLPLERIAKKAKITAIVAKRGLGPLKRDKIAKHEETYGYRSLVGLGHVRVLKKEYDSKTEYVYAITPSGMKAAERNEEKIESLGKPHPRPYSVHEDKKRWWL